MGSEQPVCPVCGQSVETVVKRHKTLGAWVPVWGAGPCRNPDCPANADTGRPADSGRPAASDRPTGSVRPADSGRSAGESPQPGGSGPENPSAAGAP
ncbi:hypothetical protein [Streptomyces sp. NPDC046727]|uniref:hypothetical protein n=1 Tax=Streptomyces sp. NPDC046727 TaxID=3155373 RepID=UPI0034058600